MTRLNADCSRYYTRRQSLSRAFLAGLTFGALPRDYPAADDASRQTRIRGAVAHAEWLEQDPLRLALYTELRDSLFDFCTVAELAQRLGADEHEIRETLLSMVGDVRRPVMRGAQYDDWFRLKSRGLTRQEKRARWRALVTFQPMRDNW